MIWDGIRGMPYELPDFNAAVKDAPKAMRRYFSELYVRHREEFYYDTFPADRTHISWQTGKEEMADYAAAIDPKNPDSPLVTIGKRGFVEIGVTGSDVTYDKEHNRYQSAVYYTRREQIYGQPRATAISMKAEFTWEQHPENVPDSARDYSPIGMVVIHYHQFKEGVSQ
jgi:type IV secretory pathway component VirB8